MTIVGFWFPKKCSAAALISAVVTALMCSAVLRWWSGESPKAVSMAQSWAMVPLLWLASACLASQEVFTFLSMVSEMPLVAMSSMVLMSSVRASSSCSGEVPR